jgi:hypothetical protein
VNLELRHPLDPSETEKLVIIFVDGRTHGEPGCWDGQIWVDQNGYPQTITHWAEFPKKTYIPAELPQHLKPKGSGNRLLIVACSGTKSDQPGEMPAIDRYTGAYYQMIKNHQGPLPEIVILSAKYGFIRANELIPDYNQLMTKERASELMKDTHRFGSVLNYCDYDEVFVAAGRDYRAVINVTFAGLWRTGIKIEQTTWVSGGIGTQRSQLKAWLAKGAEQ